MTVANEWVGLAADDEIKDLKNFALGVQEYRRQMVGAREDTLGTAGQLTQRRQLLPWLTGATYGQMTASDVFDGALHSFAGGASGFAFFSDSDFDNPGKILALSSAAGLAVDFEDHLFTGTSVVAPDHIVNTSNVLAAAGMRIDLDVWMVVTPASRGVLKFRLLLPFLSVTNMNACELISGRTHNFEVTTHNTLEVSLGASSTVVLHLSPQAGVCKATSLWYPTS